VRALLLVLAVEISDRLGEIGLGVEHFLEHPFERTPHPRVRIVHLGDQVGFGTPAGSGSLPLVLSTPETHTLRFRQLRLPTKEPGLVSRHRSGALRPKHHTPDVNAKARFADAEVR
jgi:hypothetical protein